MPETTDATERPSFGDWLRAKASEPVEAIVKRYRCPHCRYSPSARKPVVEHIARCWHNPANRACKTCVHFEPANSAEDEECLAGVELPVPDPDGGKPTLASNCPVWTGPVEEDVP